MQEAGVADVAEESEIDLVGRRHVLEHDCFEGHGGQGRAAMAESVKSCKILSQQNGDGGVESMVGCLLRATYSLAL